MFHISKPIEPLVLRVLALVAFIELGTNCCATVSDVANAVADHEPGKLLEARQTITRLLYAKRLSLQPDTVLELGQPMLTLLPGGGNDPGSPNECLLLIGPSG